MAITHLIWPSFRHERTRENRPHLRKEAVQVVEFSLVVAVLVLKIVLQGVHRFPKAWHLAGGGHGYAPVEVA